MSNVDSFADEVQAHRKPAHEVLPLFINRWSPRSMTGEPIADGDFLALFEAARWAPSSYNNQPWRFITARRDDAETFAKFADLLVPGNREWAKEAAVLVVVASRTTFEHSGKPSITHAYDTGAAWENLALEAARRGLVAHGMQGFDYARAKSELGVPDGFEVQAMIAIGKRGPRERLSERTRAMEQPNDRKPLRETVFRGAFGRPLE
jgi:nitroreductase